MSTSQRFHFCVTYLYQKYGGIASKPSEPVNIPSISCNNCSVYHYPQLSSLWAVNLWIERVRKDYRRTGAKRKSWGEVSDTISRGRKIIVLLEGSQTLPARPAYTSEWKWRH
jgi:hypothetical protein